MQVTLTFKLQIALLNDVFILQELESGETCTDLCLKLFLEIKEFLYRHS